VNNYVITTGVTNGNITITPNGTGNITLGSITINGSTITANDSSIINVDENLIVDGTLRVDGAANLGTSLTLASGATITEFSTNTSLGTSNTVVPTQNAVKSYVDTQLTASNLAFAGDTGGTLNIDLDSETLTIAGGTGIDTSGSGNTLTIAIDSSVATLTGGQVLTNKTLTTPTINGATMTGTVSVDNIIFNDSEIATNSNANLNLNPGGTGTIELQSNTNVTGTFSASGNTTISGTLSTADITTVGNQTISGNLTTGGVLTVQGSIIADIFTTNSNGNITIDPAGTGSIILSGTVTHAGVQNTTGQLNVDNLRLDGNTISATTGSIDLQAATGQNIQFNSKIIASAADISLIQATTVRTDKIQNDTSNADIMIESQGTGVVDFRTATQGTVGPVGAASKLPLDSANEVRPVGYLKIKISGTDYVIPYFNAS
jgi:hypothetical protein